jgi:hypothetical protein
MCLEYSRSAASRRPEAIEMYTRWLALTQTSHSDFPILQMPEIIEIEPFATLTCPKCGHEAKELMPTNACQFYYDCKGCGALLRPLKGDCCVYCSFGDVKCPPIQAGNQCC